MNYVLVDTWEAFKLSYATITYSNFKKTNLFPLYPLYIDTNHQACLAGTQQSNKEKSDEIGQIAKAGIAPIEMERVITTDPMVILRYKGRCKASSNLLIRADTYDTMRIRTVLPLHQIKTVEREMKRQRMVHMNNIPVGDGGCRMNPEYSSGIYTTAVNEDQCRIVAEYERKQDEVI